MKKYYCTFGMGQPNSDRFVVIEANSSSEACEIMHSHFGSVWSMCYDESDWYIDNTDPMYRHKCMMSGLDPNGGPYSQEQLYNLCELKIN